MEENELVENRDVIIAKIIPKRKIEMIIQR